MVFQTTAMLCYDPKNLKEYRSHKFTATTNLSKSTNFVFIHIGLSLTLDVEQDEYIGSVSPEAGIRVSLQEQGMMPFPFENGFSIAPGTATSVGLRKASNFTSEVFSIPLSLSISVCWSAFLFVNLSIGLYIYFSLCYLCSVADPGFAKRGAAN